MATEFSHNEEQQNAQNNIYKEGQTSGKMTIAEAIERLSEIVKKNENYMAQAFANAPEWQQRAMMTMTTLDKSEKSQKNSHTVVNVPSSFTKEQKDALKEYATEMGGTFTDMKVVEHGPDGTENVSFSAIIEFGKNAAYTPEVCAKMLLGEEKDSLIKEIIESNAAHVNKLNTTQDNGKKMSNSYDQCVDGQKKKGLKL